MKVHINLPAATESLNKKSRLLIYYALPNGNTTAQTIGKALKPGDDWHYDIQHIAAQTRFLRRIMPDREVIIAYLEAGQKSWPAWRKTNTNVSIPAIFSRIRDLCPTNEVPTEIVLASHSGGGSLIFGYLNALERIPNNVVRIAFLDSNYAYDSRSAHDRKLVDWLRADAGHHLCVLAYDDANALFEGKSFVSAAGGTWGRSHAMQMDMARHMSFTANTNGGFERFSAMSGQVQFILLENPERKVLHTVQVEKNGFIHSFLAGTPRENEGYTYFGARAYSDFISTDAEM